MLNAGNLKSGSLWNVSFKPDSDGGWRSAGECAWPTLRTFPHPQTRSPSAADLRNLASALVPLPESFTGQLITLPAVSLCRFILVRASLSRVCSRESICHPMRHSARRRRQILCATDKPHQASRITATRLSQGPLNSDGRNDALRPCTAPVLRISSHCYCFIADL